MLASCGVIFSSIEFKYTILFLFSAFFNFILKLSSGFKTGIVSDASSFTVPSKVKIGLSPYFLEKAIFCFSPRVKSLIIGYL